MNDDPLMRALAEQAKREKAEDASIPPALARPLDAHELDAILGGATAALGKSEKTRVAPTAAAPAHARRPLTRFASMAAPLMAAAAIAFLVMRPRTAGPAFPPYDLVVEGASRATRSSPDVAPLGAVHVERDGHLVLVLRPRVPGSMDAQARVMIERDGRLTRWEADARASEEGAIRIDARGDALAALPSGASRLVVFISDASHLPSDEASARRAQRGEAPGVQALVQAIDVAP